MNYKALQEVDAHVLYRKQHLYQSLFINMIENSNSLCFIISSKSLTSKSSGEKTFLMITVRSALVGPPICLSGLQSNSLQLFTGVNSYNTAKH